MFRKQHPAIYRVASGMAIADPTEPVAIPVVYLAVAPTASSRTI